LNEENPLITQIMEENAPYLSNLWEVRGILRSHFAKDAKITAEKIISLLEELINKTEDVKDITVKTDLRIILNWLEKRKHLN